MSQTLGEKLRQARETRNMSISDVAEQTRISALYLSCIENDDFRTLPGGIFNKGFVKSFAKSVGVDEQEALQDYSQLIAGQGIEIAEEKKNYRSEVLTDENNAVSNLPTIIAAIVILALMTGGILFLVNYLQRGPAQIVANTNSANTNSKAVNSAANVVPANTSVSNAPSMENLKVEFKALKSPVALSSTTDGKKFNGNVAPENPRILEPKKTLQLSYAKAQSANVEMIINGKTIALPTTNGTRNVIAFEINGENLKQIYDSGQINAAADAPR